MLRNGLQRQRLKSGLRIALASFYSRGIIFTYCYTFSRTDSIVETDNMGAVSMFLLILVTVLGEYMAQGALRAFNSIASSMLTESFLVPPLGIFFVSGCSVDLCVNILLTILGSVLHPHPLIYGRQYHPGISY